MSSFEASIINQPRLRAFPGIRHFISGSLAYQNLPEEGISQDAEDHPCLLRILYASIKARVVTIFKRKTPTPTVQLPSPTLSPEVDDTQYLRLSTPQPRPRRRHVPDRPRSGRDFMSSFHDMIIRRGDEREKQEQLKEDKPSQEEKQCAKRKERHEELSAAALRSIRGRSSAALFHHEMWKLRSGR